MTPLVLCVLDGFGLAPPGPDNAITLAHAPTWNTWWAVSYTHLTLPTILRV